MTTPNEDIEGTATELVPSNGNGALYATDDPMGLLAGASEKGKALVAMIRAQPEDQPLVLTLQRGGKKSEHLHLPAWQFVAAAWGVVIGDFDDEPIGDGWEASATATDFATGRVVGKAKSECLRDEKSGNWRDADDYAIRGMAGTRAQSRALRSVPMVGATVVLAGYDPTPADEIRDLPGNANGNGARRAQARTRRTAARPRRETSEPITAPQRKLLFARLRDAKLTSGNQLTARAEALLLFVSGERLRDRVPKSRLDQVLAAIEDWEAVIARVQAIAAGEQKPADKAEGERAKQAAALLERARK